MTDTSSWIIQPDKPDHKVLLRRGDENSSVTFPTDLASLLQQLSENPKTKCLCAQARYNIRRYGHATISLPGTTVAFAELSSLPEYWSADPASRGMSDYPFSQLDENGDPPLVEKTEGHERPPVILLSGPPCSGKGTLVNSLKDLLPGWSVIATGDLLRHVMTHEDSDRARHIRHIMENGLAADAEVVNAIVLENLEKLESRNVDGIIMDGVVRKPLEAECMIENGWTPSVSIVLEPVMDEETTEFFIQRSCGRMFHKPSGRIYHETFNPPKKPGLDDITGEPLTRRNDDNRENYLNRLSWYETSVRPAINLIEKSVKEKDGIVVHIPVNKATARHDVLHLAMTAIKDSGIET